jgi:hypothetical protein
VNQGNAPEDFLDLDDRYGRTRTRAQIAGKFFTITLILALFSWLLWAANYHSDPAIKVNLISFKAVNEKSMGINFQVTRRDPNQSLTCRLVAVDIDKYVVGEISYRVPPGKKSETISTIIPTRSYSVSASVSRCALTS